MTKKETYKLNFYKTQAPNGRVIYHCNYTELTHESGLLCSLLNSLSNVEPETLLEEIDYALEGKYFEEYYSVDGATYDDGVQIVPPNAIIDQRLTIALTDLKSLLEE